MLNAQTVQGSLDHIYGTALGAGAWPEALRQLGGLFNCHFADVFQRTSDYSAWKGIQFGLDEADYQDCFLKQWTKTNVWATRRPTQRSGNIVTTREILSGQDLRRSDMYLEYLRPRKLQEGLRLDVWADLHGVEDVSLLRPWSAGAFTAEELQAASVLMPHLQRASLVRRRLAKANGLADVGLASLEHVRMAVLLLEADGRLAHANRAAEAMLRSGEHIRGGSDGLAARTHASTQALQRLVSRALVGRHGLPRSGSIRLPCGSGGPDLLAVAIPMRPVAYDPFNLARPMAFLCLIDREQHLGPPPGCLSALFGLTPAEDEVARDLLEGKQVQDIARQTGRSVHTIRSLLSRVMAKTETTRQADFIRLVAMLPSLPQAADPSAG